MNGVIMVSDAVRHGSRPSPSCPRRFKQAHALAPAKRKAKPIPSLASADQGCCRAQPEQSACKAAGPKNASIWASLPDAGLSLALVSFGGDSCSGEQRLMCR